MYTIGHGNRTIDEFIKLLKKFKIKYIIDVRTTPYSKYSPQFNQEVLRNSLEHSGITYVFMGDSIGGRPADNSCYDTDGRVDYQAIEQKDFYKQGIERLETAFNKSIPLALMCSESKPTECHRSKLIGRTLSRDNIWLNHIDENGKLKSQQMVMNELMKGKNEMDLFGNAMPLNSRKSYQTDDEKP